LKEIESFESDVVGIYKDQYPPAAVEALGIRPAGRALALPNCMRPKATQQINAGRIAANKPEQSKLRFVPASPALLAASRSKGGDFCGLQLPAESRRFKQRLDQTSFRPWMTRKQTLKDSSQSG
jgi:hypothetical protein